MNFLNTAIYSRLSGATALTSLLGGTASIYSLEAPEGAKLPYVVFNVQGGGDENLTQNRTKNLIVLVKGYAARNSQAGSIDAQIDTALHMVPFTNVSGWSNIWLAREQDLEVKENTPNGTVFMNGATYRIRFDST